MGYSSFRHPMVPAKRGYAHLLLLRLLSLALRVSENSGGRKPVFTNPLNKLQGGVLRLEAVDPLWVRRHLLRLEHQEVAPPPPRPRPLKALLLPPLPPARRGRFPLWLFFEAAKLRAKLLRVLAQRQTQAA